MGTLREQFDNFHNMNPHVYTALCTIARQVKERKTRYGIAAIFERLRWISEFETTGDIYKLNNNHRAFYARMLMQEPEFKGFFQLRQQRLSEASEAS